nr:hypothetical protein [Tanacetum cinerariifolium]
MNQESKPRDQDSSRKTMNVEDTSSKATVAIDVAGSQISDNSRTGLGFTSYNAVSPPPTGLFAPLTIDLSNSGLEEFQHPEFKGYKPKDILTNSGIVPISTARKNSSRAAAPVSAARTINTDAPKALVNVEKPRQNILQKSHLLSRRPFYQQTPLKNKNLNNKVNTAKANSVNTAKGNRVTRAVRKQGINVVKSLACWVWRHKIKEIYPTSLTLWSMMEGMLHLGDELKVIRLLAKAQPELVKENQEKDKNRIKTRQIREACRSREKFKAFAVDKGRKTEENKKRMVKNAYTVKKLFKL